MTRRQARRVSRPRPIDVIVAVGAIVTLALLAAFAVAVIFAVWVLAGPQ